MGLTDSVARVATFDRAVSDPMGLTDALARIATFERAVADALGLTDDVAQAVAYVRAVSDSLDVTDEIARVVAFDREISDALGLTDDVARIGQFSRAVSDALGLTDDLSSTHVAPARLTYDEHEIIPLRRKKEVRMGQIWIRTYLIPVAGADDMRPDRGDLMADESGLLGARVLSVDFGESGGQAMVPMIVYAIKPEAYSGGLSGSTFVEVRSSRMPQRQYGPRRVGSIICLSSDQVGIPDEGDVWPGESGMMALRCVATDNDDITTVPGLYLCRAYYVSYVEYGT